MNSRTIYIVSIDLRRNGFEIELKLVDFGGSFAEDHDKIPISGAFKIKRWNEDLIE